jgi:hypothetical protein
MQCEHPDCPEDGRNLAPAGQQESPPTNHRLAVSVMVPLSRPFAPRPDWPEQWRRTSLITCTSNREAVRCDEKGHCHKQNSMPEYSTNLPLFNEHPLYEKSDRWEFMAHDQTFVLYEFSIGFVSHRLFREQFELWLGTTGRYLAGLEDSPANTRRLRDLAWHLWYRGRPHHDASRPVHRTGPYSGENPLRYRDLLTEDLRPLFEESTFWLAERLVFGRNGGHIWKVLVGPLHVAPTRVALERLILDDIASPWRRVYCLPSPAPGEWLPDRPSRRWP